MQLKHLTNEEILKEHKKVNFLKNYDWLTDDDEVLHLMELARLEERDRIADKIALYGETVIARMVRENV